jgi:glycosyltransferase involved in cell wall biosynthesis
MKSPLVYIHNGTSTFVEKDIQILNENYAVKVFHFKTMNKFVVPFQFLNELIFLSLNLRSKHYVIQFAGYHSFLPIIFKFLFRKKCIVVLGGSDCVSFPSIKYGSFLRQPLRFFTYFSIKNASHLCPVDETLVNYAYTYQEFDFKNQGYLAHFPRIKTPYTVIFNGYEKEKWLVRKKEKNTFVTIGANLGSRFGIGLKGIDLIIEIAEFFPEAEFYIIGGKVIHKEVSKNIHLLDTIPNDELPNFLATKEYYLQLSLSEGFPNALCEAMLCGCIPIVSNVGAMPMIVEGIGGILQTKSVSKLRDILNEYLTKNSQEKKMLSEKSRQRICEKYTLKNRQSKLLKLISRL